jgi:hypothetical protein
VQGELMLPPRAHAAKLDPGHRRHGREGSFCRRGGRTRGELLPPPVLGFFMLQLLYTSVATNSWRVAIIRLHVAIISRICCKSLCTCCIRVLDMLRVSHADVSKLGLNFLMLQTLIFDVADVVLMLGTRDVGCCKHCGC